LNTNPSAGPGAAPDHGNAAGADAVVVRPIALGDVEGFRACVDAVMQERRWLAYVEAFSLSRTAAFVAGNLESGNPQYVADDGGRIVGWCDVCRESIPTYAHCGMLGMGVLPPYRGRGVGARLLAATLAAARERGFERVELSVYAHNTAAQALYRRAGFAHEGTRVRGRKLDGEYADIHMMGLVFAH
jgi:ribosomal protein S18 acetylase RimI-like enzyme